MPDCLPCPDNSGLPCQRYGCLELCLRCSWMMQTQADYTFQSQCIQLRPASGTSQSQLRDPASAASGSSTKES